MKRNTRLKIKKVTLNILSVSLLLILVVPICVLVTEALGILFAQTAFSLAVVCAYAATYGASIFTMYKLARNVFNFLKDEVVVGHKSIKRKMKNICKSVKRLEETKDIYNKAETLSCVEDLIKGEGNILEKADETIELLSQLSRNNALELLFAYESKDELVMYIAQLQKLRQEYEASINKFELIKEGRQFEDIKNELKKKAGNSEENEVVLTEESQNQKIEHTKEI